MAKKTEKKQGNVNTDLNEAKKAKNDEFYTQLTDIAEECKHYEEQFCGKTILCNCDDPRVSNFFCYFFTSFYRLGLKKIISVCYKNLNPDLFSQHKDEQAVYCVYEGKNRTDDVIEDGDYEAFVKKNDWQTLRGDGDFRCAECIELLTQADIVVTNPPFSLFREFVAQLMQYKKQFLIMGHQNAIIYKEIFPFIKQNRLWLGYNNFDNSRFVIPPEYYNGSKYQEWRDGKLFGRVSGIRWFTNLSTIKRLEELKLNERYNPEKHPRYDNYDAIEVSKVTDIPIDYDGIMGVPITFLDKYNPEQFEILGSNRGIDQDPNGVYGRGAFLNGKELFKRLFIRRRQTI
jgi:hypothetical protein